jgi:hypothetical protein
VKHGAHDDCREREDRHHEKHLDSDRLDGLPRWLRLGLGLADRLRERPDAEDEAHPHGQGDEPERGEGPVHGKRAPIHTQIQDAWVGEHVCLRPESSLKRSDSEKQHPDDACEEQRNPDHRGLAVAHLPHLTVRIRVPHYPGAFDTEPQTPHPSLPQPPKHPTRTFSRMNQSATNTVSTTNPTARKRLASGWFTQPNLVLTGSLPFKSSPSGMHSHHRSAGGQGGGLLRPPPNVEPGDVVMLVDGREALVTARVGTDGGQFAALLEVAVAPTALTSDESIA